MIKRERDHIERLAQRLLNEQGSPPAAVALAKLLADAAKGHGRDVWLMVAAELGTARV